MTLKPCPRCKKLIPQGMAYCPDCKPIVEQLKQERIKARQKNYNSHRDKKTKSFYNSKDWKNLSRAKLASVAWKCEAQLEGCTGTAVEVHHIKPIRTEEGWKLRLEWDNLEAVCTHCHSLRHPEKFGHRKDPEVLDMRTLPR